MYRGARHRGWANVLSNITLDGFASSALRRVADPILITIAGVSRAHFYADAVRDMYGRLPDLDEKAKEPVVRGQKRKTMYGSLAAAQRWRAHYAQLMEGGFRRAQRLRATSSTMTYKLTS